MAAVIASGLLFAWVREQRSVVYASVVIAHSPVAWLASGTGFFIIARKSALAIRGRAGRSLMTLSCVLLTCTVAHLSWGDYRTIHRVNWLGRDFPYPDRAILALERWFDSRHPPTRPGSLKIHGEFPRVEYALGVAILILVTIDGLLIGLRANSRGQNRTDNRAESP